MSKIVNNSEKGHWYDLDGKACHEQPYAPASIKKDPAKAGQKRSTTIRDARKLNLLPSVTQVMKILAKDGLEAWKIEQALIAADAIKRGPTEPVDEWAKRAYAKSREQVDDAVDIGHKVHDAADRYARAIKRGDSTPIRLDAEVAPVFLPAKRWMDAHLDPRSIFRTEFTVVGQGYAGTLDLWSEVAGLGNRIVDFKTRNWKGDKPPAIYIEQGIQLAAYRMAVAEAAGSEGGDLGMTSVIISSVEPKDVFVHDWTREEMDRYDLIWKLLLELWISIKNYDPRV